MTDLCVVLNRARPGDRPGSWANREENGFYQGVLIQIGANRKIKVDVNDPLSQLSDKLLQLYFDGDGTLIEVYTDPAMTPESQIHSGDTFDIGEFEYIYVKGVGPGSTEILLTLEDPLTGRPISDILVVNVTG